MNIFRRRYLISYLIYRLDTLLSSYCPNLIYIFMESMESSYASTQDGGALEYNLIPNLTKLEKKIKQL